ncbi:hypothetical protein BDK92_2776 [Micromonospora pisi]|uniref:Uncharacterized protein n=1 Tax=Micromonospora pisi TaxID=589240 RepID=A0A495JIQ4_9ACTN|nr:hypothetical protein [Micromonospora pisi]RKR88448.1 hypothetical protein BDK92_2776 [Micromonospora pisi]
MAIYLNERPSVQPTVLAPVWMDRALLSVCTPLIPQAYQASVQAELVQAELVQADLVQTELVQAAVSAGINGSSGFTGEGIHLGKKRMDVRGVPPRGRPV